jgi:hypothetical protein
VQPEKRFAVLTFHDRRSVDRLVSEPRQAVADILVVWVSIATVLQLSITWMNRA